MRSLPFSSLPFHSELKRLVCTFLYSHPILILQSLPTVFPLWTDSLFHVTKNQKKRLLPHLHWSLAVFNTPHSFYILKHQFLCLSKTSNLFMFLLSGSSVSPRKLSLLNVAMSYPILHPGWSHHSPSQLCESRFLFWSLPDSHTQLPLHISFFVSFTGVANTPSPKPNTWSIPLIQRSQKNKQMIQFFKSWILFDVLYLCKWHHLFIMPCRALYHLKQLSSTFSYPPTKFY